MTIPAHLADLRSRMANDSAHLARAVHTNAKIIPVCE
jgi:hypothetical protein